MEANLQPGPLASTSRAWPPPFATLTEGTAPGVGKCLSPPKKGAGGGAPSLIAAEVGRDRSQPPFSAFGADGQGHRQKKRKKKKKKPYPELSADFSEASSSSSSFDDAPDHRRQRR